MVRKIGFFWPKCVLLQADYPKDLTNMINRELIRLKVIQITYAYYQNGGKNIDTAEKELFFSLSKAYDLYNYLLLLLVEIQHIAVRAVETAQNRYNRIHEGEMPGTKFIDNRFMAQLEVNRQLLSFRDNQKRSWSEEEEFVRSLYNRIIESDYYKAYMAAGPSDYAEDRELWRKIYKNIICHNEELDNLLEDMSLYWNDDKFIVDTFVLKTIKRFEAKKGASQELLPEFRDEEDRDFAHRLFRHSLLNADAYRHLIAEQTKNWEFNRIALMDIVVMQTALAEMMTFPAIPVNVTLNEYVEIAKMYSTPRSGAYVNGLLDAIAKRLIAENKLRKE